jgi:hypothetical protein
VTEPDWWLRAKALEKDGRLEEAERAVNDAVPHLGAAASIAQLYLERMLRLQEAGEMAAAAEAYQESSNWIYFYASQATSGGEGMALSVERDEFLRELQILWHGKQ